MKLRDKKSVAASLATQHKSEIDKGVKLAERIDALRETKAKEEKQLEEWRRETVARIQISIDEKIREKDSLDGAIQNRKEELTALLQPLDQAWCLVHEAEDAIAEANTHLAQRTSELKEAIALNIRRERMNEQEKQRCEEETRLASEARSKAEELAKDAARELMKARTEAQKIVTRAKEREEAVTVRETEIAEQEKKLKEISRQQAKRQKEQENKDKEIADKYETLQRTLDRTYGRSNKSDRRK